MLIRNSLHVFVFPDLSCSDLTVLKLEKAGVRNLYISSAYMAHVRHALWSSSQINKRGESLFDFIIYVHKSIDV